MSCIGEKMNIMALNIAEVDLWTHVENTETNNTEKLAGTIYHSFQPLFCLINTNACFFYH